MGGWVDEWYRGEVKDINWVQRARQEPRETQWLVGAMRHAGTPQGDEDIEGVQLGTLTNLCRTNRFACVHLGTCCGPLASEKKPFRAWMLPIHMKNNKLRPAGFWQVPCPLVDECLYPRFTQSGLPANSIESSKLEALGQTAVSESPPDNDTLPTRGSVNNLCKGTGAVSAIEWRALSSSQEPSQYCDANR